MPQARVPLTGIVVTFVAGIVSAPYVKPVLRMAIRATVGGAIRARKFAASATEELQDIVAEASAAQDPPPGA
jgi:Protein of unknown function (DUF5132)